MKKLWLPLMVIPLELIHAQVVHHAPTVEQCHADQRLWLDKLEEPNGAGVAYVTYEELGAWFHEMYECGKVDPANDDRYYNTGSEGLVRGQMRLEDFLQRHNLWNQFIAEDAQGCRGSEPCKPQGIDEAACAARTKKGRESWQKSCFSPALSFGA
jgi:hypothetical protein